MYTDKILKLAVKKGVFLANVFDDFVTYSSSNDPSVD